MGWIRDLVRRTGDLVRRRQGHKKGPHPRPIKVEIGVYIIASQGMPKIGRIPLEAGKGKEVLPCGFQKERACQYFDFQFLASRTVR